MKLLTAYVSGKVQRVGYRTRLIQIANSMRITGFSEYLRDGRVKIVAEGEEENLKLFDRAIDIKSSPIDVYSIERVYSPPRGNIINGFYKLVGPADKDLAIDEAISLLKDMRDILISWKDHLDKRFKKEALRCFIWVN